MLYLALCTCRAALMLVDRGAHASVGACCELVPHLGFRMSTSECQCQL